MNKSSAGDPERKVLEILHGLGFKPVSFYRYPYAVEILGYMGPFRPLTIPFKVIVQIVRPKLTLELLESFLKAKRNSLADRMVLFSSQTSSELEPAVQSGIIDSKTEFFGRETVNNLVKQRRTRKHLHEIVASTRLVAGLPDLARQIIPPDLEADVRSLNLNSWEVFEDAVYAVFRSCLSYEVRRLGVEALFEREPEGVVVTSNDPHFALLYECKSASDAYKMTVDDERAYEEYIKKKKPEVKNIDHSELRYFVILSPDFQGDLIMRRNNVMKTTGVPIVFLKADTLRRFAEWADKVPPNLKNLIDLRQVFGELQDAVVSDGLVKEYVKKFDEQYKSRY